MSTPTTSAIERGVPGISGPGDKLEAAYRGVLGEAFGASIRSICSTKQWYEHNLSDHVVFRFWVCDNIESGDSPEWLFDPIRSSERIQLCDELGISAESVANLSPGGICLKILEAANLALFMDGDKDLHALTWETILALIEGSQDERASVQARSAAERFLKTILFFACHTGAGETFLQTLRNPGNLRVPSSLKHLDEGNAEASREIMSALASDHSGLDLGFLTLALRKLDSALAKSEAGQVVGTAGVFTAEDQSAFEELAKALQSYAHHKPTALGTRREVLRTAIRRVLSAIERMASAKTIPESGVVVEVGESVIGSFFRVQKGASRQVLTAPSRPPLGSQILFLSDSRRDFSPCRWAFGLWTASVAAE